MCQLCHLYSEATWTWHTRRYNGELLFLFPTPIPKLVLFFSSFYDLRRFAKKDRVWAVRSKFHSKLEAVVRSRLTSVLCKEGAEHLAGANSVASPRASI